MNSDGSREICSNILVFGRHPRVNPRITAKVGADVLFSCSNLIARPIPFIAVVRFTYSVPCARIDDAPCSFMLRSSRRAVILHTAPVCPRPGERVHLPCHGFVQAPAVVAHGVEVKMATPFDIAEVGPGPELLHRRFE
jgi:hypothetical protein